MSKICSLFIKFNFEDFVSKYTDAHLYSGQFEAELMDEDEFFNLRVYYEPHIMLELVMARLIQIRDYVNFGRKITVVECSKDEHIITVDFTHARLLNLTSSSKNYRHNKKFFDIHIDRVRITRSSNDGLNLCEFYLNDSAYRPIRDIYGLLYPANVDKTQYTITKPRQYWIKALGIEFNINYDFATTDSRLSNVATITKKLRLYVRTNNKSSDEIFAIVDIICSALTFWTHEKIDYTSGRYFGNGTSVVDAKCLTPSPQSNYLDSFFTHGYHKDAIKFLKTVDYEQFQKYDGILITLIDRYNLTEQLTGESKFLTLYSILEQLKEKFTKGKSSREKFEFSVTNAELNKVLSEGLEPILKLVRKNDRLILQKQISNVRHDLKYKPMVHQFDHLLNENKVPKGEWRNKFESIVRFRNKVVHGTYNLSDEKKILEYNDALRYLIGFLLLKIVGVKSIKFINFHSF